MSEFYIREDWIGDLQYRVFYLGLWYAEIFHVRKIEDSPLGDLYAAFVQHRRHGRKHYYTMQFPTIEEAENWIFDKLLGKVTPRAKGGKQIRENILRLQTLTRMGIRPPGGISA